MHTWVPFTPSSCAQAGPSPPHPHVKSHDCLSMSSPRGQATCTVSLFLINAEPCLVKEIRA